MNRTRCPNRSHPPTLEPEQLSDLVDRVLAAAGTDEADLDRPMAIGVAGTGSELDLAVDRLGGAEPVRQLYGFVAPLDWTAFGLVGSGSALTGTTPPDWASTRPVPPDSKPESVDDRPRVRFGYLVSRSGHSVVRLRGGHDGQATDGPEPALSGPAAVGRVPDACRRVLGLATAPPPVDTGELWAVVWLEAVLIDAAVDPRRTWPQVLAAHPGLRALHPPTIPVDPDDEHGIISWLGPTVAGRWSWAHLRAEARRGMLAGMGIEAAEAAWMDVGMFSREVLGAFPPLDELLGDLRDLLPPPVVLRIEQALAMWGLGARAGGGSDRRSGRGR